MEQRSRLEASTSRATQTIKQSPQDIYCAFRAAAREYSNRPALTHPSVTRTYGELMQRTEKLAGALSRRGVHRGDRIALLLPSTPQMVEAVFSLLRLGAAAVMTPPMESPQQLLTFLQQAEIKGMIVSDDQARHLEGIRHRHSLDTIILTATVDNAGAGARMLNPLLRKIGGMPSVGRTAKDNLAERLKTILKEQTPAPQRQIIDSSETVAIFHDYIEANQSVLTAMDHTALYSGQQAMGHLAELNPLDVVLNLSPVYTGFGLTTGILAPIMAGACLAFPGGAQLKAAFDACRKLNVTVLIGPEKLLSDVAGHRSAKRRVDNLRLVLADSAPLNADAAMELTKFSGEKPKAFFCHRQAAGAIAGTKGDSKSFAPLPGVQVELRLGGQQGQRMWARGANIVGGWINTGHDAQIEDGGRFTLGGGGRRAHVA